MDAERAFLQAYRPEDYERPSLAVDVVVLTVQQRRLYVLLGERKEHPHRGRWSLPGGFVGMEESLASAARRVMEQRVQRSQVFLEQLYSFGEPSRDPRMRVVSVSYYALVCACLLYTSDAADE